MAVSNSSLFSKQVRCRYSGNEEPGCISLFPFGEKMCVGTGQAGGAEGELLECNAAAVKRNRKGFLHCKWRWFFKRRWLGVQIMLPGMQAG